MHQGLDTPTDSLQSQIPLFPRESVIHNFGGLWILRSATILRRDM
jgi:hypothetical protein